MHWHLPSWYIDLDSGLNLYLHPFFVYTSIDGSDESVQMSLLLLITVISIKISRAGSYHWAHMFRLVDKASDHRFELGVDDF